MVLLVVIFILPVTQCQVCYPGEDLQQCAKKFNPIKTAFVGNTSCLGTHRDKLGFLGVCTDNSSHCQAGVYSDSLDCGSARICCQDNTNEILPRAQDAWKYDVIPVTVGNLEHLNKQDCGVSRTSFVLGGHKAPKGSFPFIVSFTQVCFNIFKNTSYFLRM